jgi:hypothetical protein
MHRRNERLFRRQEDEDLVAMPPAGRPAPSCEDARSHEDVSPPVGFGRYRKGE